MPALRYRPTPFGRWPILAAFTMFGVAAIALAVTTVAADGGPPWYFTTLFLAVMAWNAYWWLVRFSYQLVLDGTEFRWATPLRSGSFPVSEMDSIRPFAGVGPILVTSPGRRSAIVMMAKGLDEFTRAVQAANPTVTVDLGPFARLQERLPGRNRTTPM